MLDGLAVGDANDVNLVYRYPLSSGREPHKIALVGALKGDSAHHLIALGYNIFHLGMSVRKRGAYHGNELFEPLKPLRLTPPTLETLAIVAYRQPVTRAEIENLRRVDCSNALRRLLELRLVKILGKNKSPGRPIIYGTGRDFLSLFNLTDLKELPTLEEFDLRPQELPPAEATGTEAG